MAEITTKYLDLAGLTTLVGQIKAGDAAALKAAKDYVGAIPADATQTTVIDYLMAEIEKAQEAATFDGKASSVSVEDANNKFNATTVEGALAEVKTIADANATAVETLTGADTVAGSVAKAEKDAKAYADTLVGAVPSGFSNVMDYVDKHDAAVMGLITAETGKIDALTTDTKANLVAAINEVDANADAAKAAADAAQDDVDALEELVGFTPEEGEGKPQTVKAYIDAEVSKAAGDASQVADDLEAEIERATKAESDLQDAIDAHAEKLDSVVETLVGTDTGKSVRTIASEETAKIVNNAPQAFDTLKEIADWIGTGDVEKTTAAEILTKVNANATAISDEAERAAGVEEDLQDAIDAINNAETGILKQAKDYADSLDTAMDTRVDALEAAVGEGGAVADQIKAAIEKLDAEKSQTAGADGLALNIVEVDGVITSISGSIAANTYDAYGAASDVQGETTATVASLEGRLDAIGSISDKEITDLFNPTPVTE